MVDNKYHTAADLDLGIRLVIKAVGGHRKLGRLLGISHQAIGTWNRIPAEWLIEIEILTGIAREKLRPDLFRGFKRVGPVNTIDL